MEQPNKETICQCERCWHVFPSSQKRRSEIYPYGACPVCGGEYHILYFANRRDEYYVNCLANKILN